MQIELTVIAGDHESYRISATITTIIIVELGMNKFTAMTHKM